MTHSADDPSLPAPADRPEVQAALEAEITAETIPSPGEAGAPPSDNGDNPDTLPSQTDWFVLARKLRQHNRELIKTVVQLEQSLAESQTQFQEQLGRSRQAELLINQQNEELLANQNQITRLLAELETAHQAAQTQQEMVTSLAQQVQSCQQQLAQLERECAQIQEAYNEQCQKTLEAEQALQKSQQQFYHPPTAAAVLEEDQPPAASVSFRIARSKPGIPWVAESMALEASLQAIDPEHADTPAPDIPTEVTAAAPAAPVEEAEDQAAVWEEPHWLKAGEVSDDADGEEDYTPFTYSPEPEASDNPALKEDREEEDLALAAAFDLAQEILDDIPPVEAPQPVGATLASAGDRLGNWPSPRIFREAKKRRSFAAVELPRFL